MPIYLFGPDGSGLETYDRSARHRLCPKARRAKASRPAEGQSQGGPAGPSLEVDLETILNAFPIIYIKGFYP